MIVGIDEVGNFDPNSDEYNYFVAILIDQNLDNFRVKESQFKLWESKIPQDNRDEKGEVKGQKLTDQQLEDFYDTVIKPDPSVLFSVVRIKPSENPLEIIDKHQAIEINAIKEALKLHEANPKGNWVEWYRRILAWYNNRKPAHLLKMKCLQNILGISFYYGIGWAQLTYLRNNDISNIRNFSYKIDKDFVRAENVKIIWNEILRQFWNNFSKTDKLPLISIGSNEPHPLKKEYGFDDKKSNIKKIFRDRTQFLNSDEHFEIRMADIFGTIVHRYQNKGRCGRVYERIKKHLGARQKNYIHLTLNDQI